MQVALALRGCGGAVDGAVYHLARDEHGSAEHVVGDEVIAAAHGHLLLLDHVAALVGHRRAVTASSEHAPIAVVRAQGDPLAADRDDDGDVEPVDEVDRTAHAARDRGHDPQERRQRDRRREPAPDAARALQRHAPEDLDLAPRSVSHHVARQRHDREHQLQPEDRDVGAVRRIVVPDVVQREDRSERGPPNVLAQPRAGIAEQPVDRLPLGQALRLVATLAEQAMELHRVALAVSARDRGHRPEPREVRVHLGGRFGQVDRRLGLLGGRALRRGSARRIDHASQRTPTSWALFEWTAPQRVKARGAAIGAHPDAEGDPRGDPGDEQEEHDLATYALAPRDDGHDDPGDDAEENIERARSTQDAHRVAALALVVARRRLPRGADDLLYRPRGGPGLPRRQPQTARELVGIGRELLPRCDEASGLVGLEQPLDAAPLPRAEPPRGHLRREQEAHRLR